MLPSHHPDDSESLDRVIKSAQAAAPGQTVEITETVTRTVRIEPSGPNLDPKGFYPVSEIAVAFRVKEGVLAKRLGDQWRRENDGDWIEDPNHRKNVARLRYRLEAVLPVITMIRQTEDGQKENVNGSS